MYAFTSVSVHVCAHDRACRHMYVGMTGLVTLFYLMPPLRHIRKNKALPLAVVLSELIDKEPKQAPLSL